MKTKRIENSMYTPNITTYTYPGILSKELIQKPKIDTPALNALFTIRNGVRSKEQLHLMNPLTSVLTKGTATCEPTYTQAGDITGKTLETGLFEINLSWCKKEFQGLLSNYNVLGDDPSLVGNGLSGYELGGTLRSKILDEIMEASRLDVWKIAFLGQSAYLGSSVYSTIDGLWTHYLDAFASYCVKTVTNALPVQANSTLITNQARDTFRLLFTQAPLLLKQLISSGRPKLFVTGSMWENYLTSLEDNCCVEGSWRLQQDGAKTLYYRGVELIPLWVIDQALEFETTPYTNLLRHFAILTIPENNIFGVESQSDLNNVELCYDCRTKTTYIQGEMMFGTNFINCDLTAIAY
jgi:hypothetical protein